MHSEQQSFSQHGTFHPHHHQQASLGGYSERHPRNNIPNINTSRMISQSEMPTPGTAFDMNFTPLLPSQLLLSPFQPNSPNTFASPQFQSFGTFAANPPQNHIGSPDPNPVALSPTMFHSAMAVGQSDTNGYAGFSNQGLGMASHMAIPPQNLTTASSRTVYLGNIPPETPAEEILNHVRSGQVESVRLLPDKNCAFISFLDNASATHFHSDAILKRLSIKSQDIKVGWGKPSQVPTSVAIAVQQSQASRNVYLGNLPEDISEEELREDLGKYGPIDTVKLVREKSIGFIHFLCIAHAVKAVQQLPQEPNWGPPRRVYYGKDRCAYVSKTQQQNAAQYLGIAPGYAHVLNGVDRDVISNALAQQSVAAAAVATSAGGYSNLGNRTVYLGNIHPETTIEEICNVVRGGLLHHVRYIPDKHICFVTFIDPTAAASFYALSNMQGLMIHNRRLKIGWGKHSGALPPAIALAVSGGASRNVYVGNLDESWTEERLRQDFSEYGEIELVNTLREKSCAFVNFTNIANAIKAIEQVRQKEEYGRFKINFGKDRCGNPPRTVANGTQNAGTDDSSSPSNHALGLNREASPQHGQNGQNGQSGNPLMMYLQQQQQNGMPEYPQQSGTPQSQQHYQQQQHHQYSQSNSPFYPPASSSPLPPPTLHAPSQSFSLPSNGNVNGIHNGQQAVVPGLLAPTTAAQRAQHSRAVSLPAFAPNGQQQSQQQGNANGNGVNGSIAPNGYTNGYTNGLGFVVEGIPGAGWNEEILHHA